MSKPVKDMMTQMYRKLFEQTQGVLLVDIRGIAANQNNALRTGLAEKGIRITVVRNNLAKSAFADTALSPITDLLEGPSAVVHGGESVISVAREIIDWTKKYEELEIKGAVMDGMLFGADQVVSTLSKLPTREEALAEIVQLVISPAAQLVGTVASPGSAIVGIVGEIARKLEAGETVGG